MLLNVFWSGVPAAGLGYALESLVHVMPGAGCVSGKGARLLDRRGG